MTLVKNPVPQKITLDIMAKALTCQLIKLESCSNPLTFWHPR